MAGVSVSEACNDVIPVLRMGIRIPQVSTHGLQLTCGSGPPISAPLQRYSPTTLSVHMVNSLLGAMRELPFS